MNHVFRNSTACLAALLVLAGCSTAPVTDSNAELIPTPEFVRTAATDTEIVITRDSGMVGAGWTAVVSVDGHEAAKLRPSQQARLYVAAGDHVVAVAHTWGDAEASRETTTKAERARRFRVGMMTSTSFDLLPE